MNTTFSDANSTIVLGGSTQSPSCHMNSNSDSNSYSYSTSNTNSHSNVTRSSFEETGKTNESLSSSAPNGSDEIVSKNSSEETGKDSDMTAENTKLNRTVPSLIKRDRDRFKTIKIVRDVDPNKRGGVGFMPAPYNVHCIDNNVDDAQLRATNCVLKNTLFAHE